MENKSGKRQIIGVCVGEEENMLVIKNVEDGSLIKIHSNSETKAIFGNISENRLKTPTTLSTCNQSCNSPVSRPTTSRSPYSYHPSSSSPCYSDLMPSSPSSFQESISMNDYEVSPEFTSSILHPKGSYSSFLFNRKPSDESQVESRTTWSNNAILMLISEYKNHMDKFKCNKTRNEDVWKMIRRALIENGYSYTVAQVTNKWKHLRKLYIKEIDNKGPKSSGQGNYSFQYFNEIDEIFSDKPNVRPVSTASSILGSTMHEDIVRQSFDDTSRKRNKEDEPNKCNTKPKVPRLQSSIIKWLEENEIKKQEAKDKRHQENLESKTKAIDSFNAIMNKLIEKL